MRITINDRGTALGQRLRERLDRAAELHCDEHDQSVISVSIYDRENGWFDARWTTCCEALERRAMAIVGERL